MSGKNCPFIQYRLSSCWERLMRNFPDENTLMILKNISVQFVRIIVRLLLFKGLGQTKQS